MARSAAGVDWCYQRLIAGDPTAVIVSKAANHWG